MKDTLDGTLWGVKTLFIHVKYQNKQYLTIENIINGANILYNFVECSEAM